MANINGFGIEMVNTTGSSNHIAYVSQVLGYYSWYPYLPLYIMRLWKNDTELVGISYDLVAEAGTVSEQTIMLRALVNLNASDTLKLSVVKITGTEDYIVSGSEKSYIVIHKFEGQGI